MNTDAFTGTEAFTVVPAVDLRDGEVVVLVESASEEDGSLLAGEFDEPHRLGVEVDRPIEVLHVDPGVLYSL